MRILDTSSILHGDYDLSKGRYLVTNSVLQEIISDNAKTAADQGIRNGNVRIKDPSPANVGKAEEAAKKTGDATRLSKTDIDVLALALEEGGEILTDDYAIQNVASFLGISYQATAQDGIRKKVLWENICPSCGAKAEKSGGVCEICGTKTRRTAKPAK